LALFIRGRISGGISCLAETHFAALFMEIIIGRRLEEGIDT
jgi:hypothetical protein